MGGGGEYAAFCWKPQYGTVIRVLALDGSGVKKTFKLPPMFYYHWANTFEAEHPELGMCFCLDALFVKDPRSINMFDLDVCMDPTGNMDIGRLQYALDATADNFCSCIQRFWTGWAQWHMPPGSEGTPSTSFSHALAAS
jgi:hypothetical protein